MRTTVNTRHSPLLHTLQHHDRLQQCTETLSSKLSQANSMRFSPLYAWLLSLAGEKMHLVKFLAWQKFVEWDEHNLRA